MTFSQDRVWADMVALFRGHREQLIAVIGVFSFLPAFAIGWLVPQPDIAPSGLNAFAVIQQWIFDHWLVLTAQGVVGSIGHATIYTLLLRKEATTLAAAFGSSIKFVPSLVVANLLIGIVFGAGLVAFVVPGLYLMARTAVAGAALIGEARIDPASVIRTLLCINTREWMAHLRYVRADLHRLGHYDDCRRGCCKSGH